MMEMWNSIEQPQSGLVGRSRAPRWVAGPLRGRGPQLVWAPALTLITLGGLSGGAPYAAGAAVALALTVGWTRREQRRDRHRRARQMAETVLALRETAERYERDATTDRLTGLANRFAFYTALEHAFALPAPQRDAAVLVIDLNAFKKINDVWGHDVGDQALIRLGRVLREETRASDVAGRLGGDEFAVLAQDAGEESTWRLAERIRAAAVARPVRRDGNGAWLSLSIGVAILGEYDDADAAMIAADRALYVQKAAYHAARALDEPAA